MFEWIVKGGAGGFLRMIEGGINAMPTLMVGLLIATVLRYYFGQLGIRQLFGGDSLRSLPQSWLIGMLLPVCSIGVLPILMEMRRARVKPGALSAFALSAPLFNPLSLLYGLTLSRPYVVVMFAVGSLVVVTAVGLLWDRRRPRDASPQANALGETTSVIGISRLVAMLVFSVRQLAGPCGGWAIVGLSGLFVLGWLLPFASLQSAVERDDWMAPATMTAVAIPAYATPMLAMSQLGMMFQHANSPGAAFVLLVLGAGINLATIAWMAQHLGRRSVATWFLATVAIVVGIAYAINRPLVPPGVEPAGHTHAFDIYTNPIQSLSSFSLTNSLRNLALDLDLAEKASLSLLTLLLAAGLACRRFGWDEAWVLRVLHTSHQDHSVSETAGGFRDPHVSPRVVGGTLLVGLIAVSVVMCYAYYPPPEETLEEIRIARAETLSAARTGRIEHAIYWLQNWEDWSRRLEVGTFLRRGEIRPYQRMQGYLIRKKLELLEHELEHDPYEPEEVLKVIHEIDATNRRWVQAFRSE